jgi:hypothetical protein
MLVGIELPQGVSVEGETCGNAENKGVQGYHPQGEAEPRKRLEIAFEHKVCPVPEGFQINFFDEY